MGIASENFVAVSTIRKKRFQFCTKVFCHFFNGMHCINYWVEVIIELNLIIGRPISETTDSRTINRPHTRLEISCKMLFFQVFFIYNSNVTKSSSFPSKYGYESLHVSFIYSVLPEEANSIICSLTIKQCF